MVQLITGGGNIAPFCGVILWRYYCRSKCCGDLENSGVRMGIKAGQRLIKSTVYALYS